MSLSSFYQSSESRSPAISFELFPPKTEKGRANMYDHLQRLLEFNPAYVTCTYGAGGSTRDKTLDLSLIHI